MFYVYTFLQYFLFYLIWALPELNVIGLDWINLNACELCLLFYVALYRGPCRRTPSTFVCLAATASSTSDVATDVSSAGSRNASQSAWSKKVRLRGWFQSHHMAARASSLVTY